MTEKYSTYVWCTISSLFIHLLKLGVHVCFRIVVFSGYMPSSGITGSYHRFITTFFFLKNLYTVLHNGCFSLYSHQQCRKDSYSPAFIFCRIFWWWPFQLVWDDTSLCSVDLHFSDNYWYWASFHVFIGSLYVFFGEMSVLVCCLFFDWAVFLN